MRIHLSSIPVDDQDKALHFYTKVPGFDKKTEVPLGEHRPYVSVFRRCTPAPLLEPSLLSRAFEEAGRHCHGGRPPVRQVVHEHIQQWRPGRVKP